MADLQQTLVNGYRVYIHSNQDIATQMSQVEAGSHPPGTELLDIPNRLTQLDSELKAIDQILAAHLSQQDALDACVKGKM